MVRTDFVDRLRAFLRTGQQLHALNRRGVYTDLKATISAIVE